MGLTIIGNPPLAKDASGKLLSRIGSLFLDDGVLITLSGMRHADQQTYYIERVNAERAARGIPPLSDFDENSMLYNCVDLIMSGDNILIRPAPERVRQALAADERLQEIASKRRIRFLRSNIPALKQAIRERGEYWRICPRPQKEEEILAALSRAKIALGGLPIYYYNEASGTRFLTCQAFFDLRLLNDDDLRRHLVEIRDFSARRNKGFKPEIAFFGAGKAFASQAFEGLDFESADRARLRARHLELADRFKSVLGQDLQTDDTTNTVWLNTMCARLFDDNDETLSGDVVSDLSPEFFRMIRWLPGGRFQNGELIFDPIFSDREKYADDEELRDLCDLRVPGFIGNYTREFGRLLYVNIGWVTPSSRRRHRENGHRVYIAEVMPRNAEKPVLRILRIQQWGVREHLDRGREYDYAASQSTEYTEYTFDRRLACWELDMSLPGRIDTRMLIGPYDGKYADRFKELRIWTVYYEREFIKGLATDKIPDAFLQDKAYAQTVARLLGHAAAPNMVVGRTVDEGSKEVVFDTGDEMILSDENGQPQKIVVADHAGTFHNYTDRLTEFAPGYAQPVIRRLKTVADPEAFADTYLNALAERLTRLQDECRLRRTEFLALFQNSKSGPKTFKDRWERALNRLDETSVSQVIEAIRAEIRKAAAV